MLCPYLRSSQIGSWKVCNLQTILTYVFGFQNRAGAAASMGTCVHKMMELRALGAMAKKKGDQKFEYEDWGEIDVDWAMDIHQTIDKVYEHQQKLDHHINWKNAPKSKILKGAHKAITDFPQYDPANLNIIKVEQFFDIEIKENWAKYSREINGKTIEGYLHLKGTIDCVLDLGNNVYECFDFKHGKRSCFATGQEKTLDFLSKDHQLLFYLYALKKLYPDKDFIMSLYFINNGGIYSVVGDDKMYQSAEKMIKQVFREITNVKYPILLDPTRQDFRCKYCCEYSKPASFTNGKSVCQFFHEEIKTNGLEKTISTYADLDKITLYQDGGGKKNVEKGSESTDG